MMQEKLGKPLLLVFPFGYLSHYLRCLMLARELRAHFTIRFAAHDVYSRYVAAEGFGTFDCEPMDAAKALECVRKFDFSWLEEGALETALREQVRAIQALKPAAVLGDASPTLKMAAAATGTPFLAVINGYMSKYFADGRSLSVTHPAYPLLQKLPASIGRVLTAQGEALAFRAVHRPFKKIRRRWQLPDCRAYPDEMEGDLNLIPDLLSLFPQHRLPANYKVIAPLYYVPLAAPDAAIESRGAENKRIYVSMGSTGAWQAVAFLNDPAYGNYTIIAAGDAERVLHAPHIYHRPFADVRSIFPATDLVICHGGNGSIYQALAYGIPVLCHPSHFEQEWNVAAVVQAGLGANLATAATSEAQEALVAAWSEKKGSPVFETYQQKIDQYQRGLPDALAEAAARLVPQSLNIQTAAHA